MSATRPHALSEAQFLLVARLVMPISAFLLLVVIGRHSDKLLGEYALVTTYYYLMQTLPLLGLMPFVMREVARDERESGAIFAGVGALAVGACFALNGAWWLARPWVAYPLAVKQGIDVVAIGIFGGILAFLAETILVSLHRARGVAIIAVTENAVRLVVSIVILKRGGSVADLIWVVVVGRLCALAMLGGLLARARALGTGLGRVLAVWRRTLPVIPAFLGGTLLSLAASRLDYLVLSAVVDVAALGWYAIAYRLLEIAMMAVTAIVTSLYPRLARLYHEAPAEFDKVAAATVRVAVVLLPALACGALLCSDAYVGWLFARQYPQPVGLARAFCVVFALSGVDTVLGTLLNATDRQNRDVRALAVGTGIYAVLLLALVPHWQGWGAVGAAAGAILAQACLRARFAATASPLLRPWEAVRVGLLAAAALAGAWAIAAAAPRWLQLLIAPLGMLAYPLAAWLCGALRIGSVLTALASPIGPEEVCDERRLGGTLRMLADDLRARERQLRPGAIDNYGAVAVSLYRLSRWALLNGRRHLARLLWYVNQSLTKSELPPTTEIGPGFVVTRTVGVLAVGRIGRNVTLESWAAVGIKGKRDIGAGLGVPVIGDGVRFGPRAVLHGAIRCPAGTAVSAHAMLSHPRQMQRFVSSDHEPVLAPEAAL